MNEIVEYSEASVPAISDTSLVQLAEQAEKRIDALIKIKKCALKMTNPNDWTDQGGKPDLQTSGSEKVGRLFGISWTIDEPIFEVEDDGHFSYTYKGDFYLAGAKIQALGVRSSKDPFFKKYNYANGEKIEMPPSAIDKGDVKKAAYTNLLRNGITRILGIRNITWEELEEFAGITQEMVKKVDFKEKGKSKDKIATEGASTVEGMIDAINQQTKKKDGSAMKSPLFKIALGGNEYKTFDEKVARLAKAAKESGKKVKISFITNQYGNDIDFMTTIEEPATERQPGEDG